MIAYWDTKEEAYEVLTEEGAAEKLAALSGDPSKPPKVVRRRRAEWEPYVWSIYIWGKHIPCYRAITEAELATI